MTDRKRHVSSSYRGQGTVEFSLVALLFFAVMLGIFEGGRLLFTYHEVNHAAREGARFASAQGFHSGNVSTSAEVEAYVQTVTSGLEWDRFTLDAEWPGDPNMNRCDEQPNRDGCPVRVAVSYEFQPVVAIVFGDASITLNSTTSMRIHY